MGPEDIDGLSDTEIDILDVMDQGNADASFEDAPESSQPKADSAPSTQTANQAHPQDGSSTGTVGGDKRDSAQGRQGTADSAQPAAPVSPAGRNFSDKDGNLVDANGQILAKAGAERRLYVKAENAVQEAQRLQSELQQAQQQAQVSQVLNGLPAQYGLNHQETAEALQLIAAFKSNPVEVAQYVLEKVRALGHNLEGIGSGVDTGAIRQLIQNELAPFKQNREEQVRVEQARAEAQREYSSFMSQFPDAQIHEEPLVNLMRNNPALSLGEAYWQLKFYAQQQGLDFDRPLAQQIVERQGQQGQQQPVRGGQPQQQPRAMPSGTTYVDAGAVGPQSGSPTSAGEPTFADPTDSYESIVRQAMRAAGRG